MHGFGDVRFFNRVAALYDLVMPPADDDALATGLDRADRSVRRVLDVGGGSGRASLAIDTPERIVVDVSSGMLARAAARGLDAVAGDAARLPVRDTAVDAVVVVDALHHFPDPSAAIREAARVLRPGGVLVVREFDPGHPFGTAIAVGERLIGMDSTFFTPAELALLIGDAGLEPAVLDRGFGYTVIGVVPRDSGPE